MKYKFLDIYMNGEDRFVTDVDLDLDGDGFSDLTIVLDGQLLNLSVANFKFT